MTTWADVSSFAEQIADPHLGVAVDDRASSVALVAFGGLHGKLAMPPFEFFGLAKDWDVTKVFIRDRQQCWYQSGVPGLGSDFRSMVAGLRGLLADLRAEPVLFGTSAGGYAALASAAIGGFGEAHAFGPQTTLRRPHRKQLHDSRWPRNIRAAHAAAGSDAVLDLQPLLTEGSGTTLHVHVAADSPLDVGHAQRLEGRPGVTLHRYASGGHTFVRRLKADGTLQGIITGALNRRGADRADQTSDPAAEPSGAPLGSRPTYGVDRERPREV